MESRLKDTLIKEYIEGTSLTELYNKYKVPISSIHYIIKKAKVNRPRENTTVKHDYFDFIDNEEKAYWIGFLLADGNVYTKNYKNTISLGLKGTDKEHVQKFITCLNIKNKLYETYMKQGYSIGNKKVQIAFSSNQIVVALEEFGIIPKKSSFDIKYKIQEIIPEMLQRHFWRGVIDGDGYITISNRPQFSIGLVGTYKLLEDFLIYCKKFVPTQASIRPHSSIFDIRISSDYGEKIAGLLYNKCKIYLNRKYNIWKNWKEQRITTSKKNT